MDNLLSPITKNVFDSTYNSKCEKCGKIFHIGFRTMWPVKFLFNNDKQEFWFGAVKLIFCHSCTKKLKNLIKEFLEGEGENV